MDITSMDEMGISPNKVGKTSKKEILNTNFSTKKVNEKKYLKTKLKKLSSLLLD